MESIRKEVERCDDYKGAVLTHSTSGGTGSGLGSHLLEEIRDNYPVNYIASITVLPFQLGETPLQNYNSILTLNWAQQYADCIIMFQNEQLLKILPSNPIFKGSTKMYFTSKFFSLIFIK